MTFSHSFILLHENNFDENIFYTLEAMFGSGDSVPTGVPPTAGTPGNTPNTPPTLTPPPSTTRDPATEDWMRTVIFIEKTTSPGQDVFLRGGISYDMRPGE